MSKSTINIMNNIQLEAWPEFDIIKNVDELNVIINRDFICKKELRDWCIKELEEDNAYCHGGLLRNIIKKFCKDSE